MLNTCKNSIKILKIASVHVAMVATDGKEKNPFFDMLIFIRVILELQICPNPCDDLKPAFQYFVFMQASLKKILLTLLLPMGLTRQVRTNSANSKVG